MLAAFHIKAFMDVFPDIPRATGCPRRADAGRALVVAT
jgi:hypothetical protein